MKLKGVFEAAGCWSCSLWLLLLAHALPCPLTFCSHKLLHHLSRRMRVRLTQCTLPGVARLACRCARSYCFAVLGSSFFMNSYLVINVALARKKYGISYPALYAPPGHKDEVAFNSVQRAHQNVLYV